MPHPAFPYPLSARFSYILSALGGLTFLVFAGFAWCKLWMLVRQYQTGCTRTGGHGISEKPHDAFRSSPLLVLGADESLKGCEIGNWVLNGQVLDVDI